MLNHVDRVRLWAASGLTSERATGGSSRFHPRPEPNRALLPVPLPALPLSNSWADRSLRMAQPALRAAIAVVTLARSPGGWEPCDWC